MPKFTVDLELPAFLHDLKQALKRHPTILKDDLPLLIDKIAESPDLFPALVGLPVEVRKARMGVHRAQIGQSGGYRVLFQVDRKEAIVTLLALYYKPDYSILSLDEIRRRLAV
jgi:mRNA-degrading endonuclease RelE of RelBE toxin-antitoxin system